MQDCFLNGTASIYMWRISHEQKQTLTAEIQIGSVYIFLH